ncbi:MAG: hypothetical protein WC304_04035 [Candidatus Gracilibacteria bacterium]|nr:hypothetical protein [Candidatus Gracilibacteria bacterium]
MLKEYSAYLKDNPKGYWFKRKLYGWGWTPVKWQGWLVIVISIAIGIFGVYVGDTDDAPGAALLGILLMFALIFFFGYSKGEKPKWQWGLPKSKKGKIYSINYHSISGNVSKVTIYSSSC